MHLQVHLHTHSQGHSATHGTASPRLGEPNDSLARRTGSGPAQLLDLARRRPAGRAQRAGATYLGSKICMFKMKKHRKQNRSNTFLSSLLPGPVYVVLQLDSNLPLIGLIPYERVFQKLLCGRPLQVVLHQAPFYETKKFL